MRSYCLDIYDIIRLQFVTEVEVGGSSYTASLDSTGILCADLALEAPVPCVELRNEYYALQVNESAYVSREYLFGIVRSGRHDVAVGRRYGV